MKAKEEADKLRVRLAQLDKTMALCNHNWTKAIKSFREKTVFDYENKPMGSDYFNPIVIGSHKESYGVWERVCLTCGKVDVTTKEEPVIENYRPVFG